jgi:hypothetical protein
MILTTHIAIAILSIIITLVTYLKPTSAKIKMSYVAITSTVVSGTYLVFSLQSNILRTCVTGLLFVTVTSIITYAARTKLAHAEEKL